MTFCLLVLKMHEQKFAQSSKLLRCFFYQCEDDEILLPFFWRTPFNPCFFFPFPTRLWKLIHWVNLVDGFHRVAKLSISLRWKRATQVVALEAGGVSVNGVTGDSDWKYKVNQGSLKCLKKKKKEGRNFRGEKMHILSFHVLSNDNKDCLILILKKYMRGTKLTRTNTARRVREAP